MLRLLDDFLYVSDQQSITENFIDSLANENESYRIKINREKTKTSYTGRGLINLNGSSFLPWCGYLINVSTFEFQIDYEKLAGSTMIDTLTNKYENKPFESLYIQLLRPVRSKCSHILLDLNINSLEIIHLNVYQLFLFVSIKLITALKAIKTITRYSTNEKAILNLIQSLIFGIWKIIRRFKTSENPVPNVKFICPLSENEVQWLGLNAFLRIFNRKQTNYRFVVDSLEMSLKNKKFKKTIESKIVNAIDPKKSETLLNQIHY